MPDRDHLKNALSKLYLQGPKSEIESGNLTVNDVVAVPDSSIDRDIELLITETYSVEPSEHHLSLEPIFNEMLDGLCRAVFKAATSEKSAEKIFMQEEKDRVFSCTIGQDISTYQIIFPISASIAWSLGDKVKVLGSEIHKISKSQVKSHINNEISDGENHERDNFSGERAEELFVNIDADIWQITVEARDSTYALSQARSIIKYLFGKLNFLGHRWHSCTWSLDNQFSGDRPPGMREPPGYIILISDSAQRKTGAILRSEARNRVDAPTNLASNRIGEYDNLPSLPVMSNLDNRDLKLFNAFRSYQTGISSSETSTSFFAFWRGLENLCVDDSYSNAEMIKHAEGVLRTFSGQKLGNPEYRTGYLETSLPRIKDVIGELGDLRNNMVHSASQTEIQAHHVNAVRLLFEGYIEAYAEFYDITEIDVFEKAIRSLEPTISERTAKIDSLQKEIESIKREIELLNESQEIDQRQNAKSVDNIEELHRLGD